jgi:hypothetical protein
VKVLVPYFELRSLMIILPSAITVWTLREDTTWKLSQMPRSPRRWQLRLLSTGISQCLFEDSSATIKGPCTQLGIVHTLSCCVRSLVSQCKADESWLEDKPSSHQTGSAKGKGAHVGAKKVDVWIMYCT